MTTPGPNDAAFQFANNVQTISAASSAAQIATALATAITNLSTNVVANTSVSAGKYGVYTHVSKGASIYCIASTYPRRMKFGDVTKLVGYDPDTDQDDWTYGWATAQSGTGASVGGH